MALLPLRSPLAPSLLAAVAVEAQPAELGIAAPDRPGATPGAGPAQEAGREVWHGPEHQESDRRKRPAKRTASTTAAMP